MHTVATCNTASAVDLRCTFLLSALKHNKHTDAESDMTVTAPGLLAEHAEGNQLHEGVHADNQVWLVLLKGLPDLLGNKERGDGLRGHVDEPRLLAIVADVPHQAVAHHE